MNVRNHGVMGNEVVSGGQRLWDGDLLSIQAYNDTAEVLLMI